MTNDEVTAFLNDFKQKLEIFNVHFEDDRGINKQAILDLGIRAGERLYFFSSC